MPHVPVPTRRPPPDPLFRRWLFYGLLITASLVFVVAVVLS